MISAKRPLAVLLLAALLLTLLTPALASEKGPLYIEGSEDVTLTYWIPIDGNAAQKYTTLAEHPYFIWLKEQTGVNIEFIHPSWDQMDQQMNLMVTSGNYYDLLFTAWYPAGPQGAINDNVFLDLNQYRDIMPNYIKAITTSDGSQMSWEWGPEKERLNPAPMPAYEEILTTAQGNLWCASQLWGDTLLCENGAVIRKDWLDKLGLDIPRTLEELETVLAAFKGLGEDIIPMSLGRLGFNGASGAIVTAFDVYPAWFTINKEGAVRDPGWIDPAIKDYLALISDWHAKGYIDPDFVNRDDDGLTALMLSDRLGIMWESWKRPDQIEELYTGTQESFELAALPLPRKSLDQQLTYRQAYTPAAGNYTVITSNCQHPEIAAKWLDVQFTKEAFLRQSYGVEGESYELDENGVPYFLDEYLQREKEDPTLAACYLYCNSTSVFSGRAGYRFSKTNLEEKLDKIQAHVTWGENADASMQIGYVIFDGDGWGEMYTPYVEAETYVMPMMLKFVTGAEPLDKFDEYRETALELGFREATEKMQQAYDLMHKK